MRALALFLFLFSADVFAQLPYHVKDTAVNENFEFLLQEIRRRDIRQAIDKLCLGGSCFTSWPGDNLGTGVATNTVNLQNLYALVGATSVHTSGIIMSTSAHLGNQALATNFIVNTGTATSELNSPRICISADCRVSWPISFTSSSTILNQNTLQSGATFYTSSGTAENLNALFFRSTSTVIKPGNLVVWDGGIGIGKTPTVTQGLDSFGHIRTEGGSGNGNIGIGVTPTDAHLKVQPPASNSPFAVIKTTSTDSAACAILQFYTDAEGTDPIWSIGKNPSCSASVTYFGVREAGAGDRFIVAKGGNVGIGTGIPLNKLYVQGGFVATSSATISSTATATAFISTGSVGSLNLSVSSANFMSGISMNSGFAGDGFWLPSYSLAQLRLSTPSMEGVNVQGPAPTYDWYVGTGPTIGSWVNKRTNAAP